MKNQIYKVLIQFSFFTYSFMPCEIILASFFNNTNLSHNIDYNIYYNYSSKFETINAVYQRIYFNIKDSNIFSTVYGFKLI